MHWPAMAVCVCAVAATGHLVADCGLIDVTLNDPPLHLQKKKHVLSLFLLLIDYLFIYLSLPCVANWHLRQSETTVDRSSLSTSTTTTFHLTTVQFALSQRQNQSPHRQLDRLRVSCQWISMTVSCGGHFITNLYL